MIAWSWDSYFYWLLLRLSRLYKIESQPRPHQADWANPSHQHQQGLTGQSLYTRPHRAEPLHQISSSRASELGLIRQNLYTNANQASLGRVSTPTSTRPYQAEPLFEANQASSGRASTPGLNEQTLHINVNQASPGGASTPDFTRRSFCTRSHRAELTAPASTRPYQAEPPHQCQTGLIK